MYEVKNLRRRQTSIALPGKGILLQKKGSTGLILDHEVQDDAVQALLKIKAISVTKVQGQDTPEQETDSSVLQERRRIEVKNRAEARARLRARGIDPDANTKE